MNFSFFQTIPVEECIYFIFHMKQYFGIVKEVESCFSTIQHENGITCSFFINNRQYCCIFDKDVNCYYIRTYLREDEILEEHGFFSIEEGKNYFRKKNLRFVWKRIELK